MTDTRDIAAAARRCRIRTRDGRGPARSAGTGESSRLPRGADLPAGRGDRACAARSSASPRSVARFRTWSGREGLSLPRRTGERAWPRRPVRHGTTRSSPISGCSARNASGPARCARLSSARSTFPDARYRAAASRSPSSAARRSRASSPSPVSAAGDNLKFYQTIGEDYRPRRPCGDRRGRGRGPDVVWRRNGRSRSACSGPPRAALRPPTPASIHISRPIRPRSGRSSTGRRKGAERRLVSEARLSGRRPLTQHRAQGDRTMSKMIFVNLPVEGPRRSQGLL